MAVLEGGVDLKAADKAAKEAAKKNKTYKKWKTYLKKKPQHKEHCIGAKVLKSGNHPLVAALERCGYHDIVFHHDATGYRQAGSYQVNFKEMMKIDTSDFNVRVPDESGFLLPLDHDQCMKDCNNLKTLQVLRDIAQNAEKRNALKKIAFDGYAWKVVKKLERSSDGGAVIAACTRKRRELVKQDWFEIPDESSNSVYWQKYDGAEAIADKFTYKPSEVLEFEVGETLHCITDKAAYDTMGIQSKTPFTTEAAWNTDAENVLGFPVKILSMYDAGDGWEGYNVNVQAIQNQEGTKTYETVIPIRALRREDPNDTVLFLGEVGMFIFKMEMDLFANKGYNERNKQVQPLFAEFTGIINNFGQDEKHFGDWEWVDHDDSDAEADFKGIIPELQQWIDAQVDAEANYGNLGYGDN